MSCTNPLGATSGRVVAASLLALICPIAVLHAEVHPLRGGGDARVRTATYDPDEVYRIQGFVGFQIDLEFERGETFVGLAAGDIDALSFVAEDSHLFLKPRAASVGTNLTVLTTRRHYHFDYTATARRPDSTDPDLIYSLRFRYPPASESTMASPQAVESRLSAAPAARPRNVDYWFCGSRVLQPVAASDDGVHTRLRFAAQSELPAVFVRNDDGSESLLNFSMDSGDVIIHRVARRFILRRGALTGCVVNKAFSGTGDRLDSGTIAPDVERQRKDAEP
jgi:type IV secretion system protein VirB9